MYPNLWIKTERGKIWNDLRAGNLRMNPSDIVVIPQGAEAK